MESKCLVKNTPKWVCFDGLQVLAPQKPAHGRVPVWSPGCHPSPFPVRFSHS